MTALKIRNSWTFEVLLSVLASWAVMIILHVPYITYRVYSQSDPRKWEENQGEAKKFDSRSGRGSKPRKRYVLNFVIKRTRGHLIFLPYRSCVTFQPAQFTNNFYIKLSAYVDRLVCHCFLSGIPNSGIPNCWFFFFSRIVHGPFTFVTNSCSVNLWRAKLTQGLSPVATKSQPCN